MERRQKIAELEKKLNYLLDNPDLQRRYPKRFEIVYDRLVDRWVKLHKPKQYL